jgi:hypothetical protein
MRAVFSHSQVFNTLYLQLLGFSDFQSSLVAALFLGGTAFGAQVGSAQRAPEQQPEYQPSSRENAEPWPRLSCPCAFPVPQLGGFIGDWAAARYPSHGRVAVAQLSVGLGVPLSVAMFKVGRRGCSQDVYNWGCGVRKPASFGQSLWKSPSPCCRPCPWAAAEAMLQSTRLPSQYGA